MTDLKRLLTTLLSNAVFTIQRRGYAANGILIQDDKPKRVQSPALRRLYSDRDKGLNRWITKTVEPRKLVEDLAIAISHMNLPFVHPADDEVHLAFPIDEMMLPTLESPISVASLYRFSSALVQAAALDGVDRTMSSIEHLKEGDPLRVRACTVLDDLPLSSPDPVSPSDDIFLIRLPLKTSDLPYLPITSDSRPLDCLGRTLLSVETRSDLTYPEAMVVPDRDKLNRVCDALTIHSNRYVGPTVVWYEYPDMSSFRLTFFESASVLRRVPTMSKKK